MSVFFVEMFTKQTLLLVFILCMHVANETNAVNTVCICTLFLEYF